MEKKIIILNLVMILLTSFYIINFIYDYNKDFLTHDENIFFEIFNEHLSIRTLTFGGEFHPFLPNLIFGLLGSSQMQISNFRYFVAMFYIGLTLLIINILKLKKTNKFLIILFVLLLFNTTFAYRFFFSYRFFHHLYIITSLFILLLLIKYLTRPKLMNINYILFLGLLSSLSHIYGYLSLFVAFLIIIAQNIRKNKLNFNSIFEKESPLTIMIFVLLMITILLSGILYISGIDRSGFTVATEDNTIPTYKYFFTIILMSTIFFVFAKKSKELRTIILLKFTLLYAIGLFIGYKYMQVSFFPLHTTNFLSIIFIVSIFRFLTNSKLNRFLGLFIFIVIMIFFNNINVQIFFNEESCTEFDNFLNSEKNENYDLIYIYSPTYVMCFTRITQAPMKFEFGSYLDEEYHLTENISDLIYYLEENENESTKIIFFHQPPAKHYAHYLENKIKLENKIEEKIINITHYGNSTMYTIIN